MPRSNLLLISDAISYSSGLARITRDLAERIHAHIPEIRLATAGYGGIGSARFPWSDYHLNTVENWMIPELPAVVQDFSPDQECIVMFVWDLSRLWWFLDPAQCPNRSLGEWIRQANIKKWAYHPVDAAGVGGKLNLKLAGLMSKLDRVLDYSAFSSRVTGNPDHLPHGIDTHVFRPHDRRESRIALNAAGFGTLAEKSLMVGIVATNQVRKDWALGLEACRILLDRGYDVQVWAHIDTLERHWSLPNLIADFGLQNRVAITSFRFSDDQMAQLYSACDVTLGIGSEGYGYPIFESLACGVPCISGDYAGAAEHLPPSMKVKPIAFRYDGPFNCQRPVFNPKDWADAAEENNGIIASLPDSLDWHGRTLWPAWEKWFREGIA